MNNGYTNIVIDGKTIGLKFALPSVQMLIDKVKKFPNLIYDASHNLTLSGWAFVIYSGYVNNCIIKDVVPEYDYEFFCDYVESVSDNAELAKPLNEVIIVWTESRSVQQIIEKGEEIKKKNSSATKLKHTATVH